MFQVEVFEQPAPTHMTRLVQFVYSLIAVVLREVSQTLECGMLAMNGGEWMVREDGQNQTGLLAN